MTDAIEIIRCDEPAELHRHYSGQFEPQPVYIALNLRTGSMWASHNAEVGNARPVDVVHGFQRRYPVPILTAQAANRVMAEIAPMAARMFADWEKVWDGNNMIAELGADADAAERDITAHLAQDFDDSDVVGVWDLDGLIDGSETEQYGITAQTPDERLDEIAAELTGAATEGGPNTVCVVDGLGEHLRDLRREAAEQTA